MCLLLLLCEYVLTECVVSVLLQANVMGANCDLCKQGFYNLQASNPEGCTECFCFGVSDVCESSTWTTLSVDLLTNPNMCIHVI